MTGGAFIFKKWKRAALSRTFEVKQGQDILQAYKSYISVICDALDTDRGIAAFISYQVANAAHTVHVLYCIV